MMKHDRPSAGWLAILLVILLLPATYIGAYYAMLEPEPYFNPFSEPMMSPRYRVGETISETIFWPTHQIDRRIRTEHWSEPKTHGGII